MSALIEVILPVFLVIGFGYLAVWRGLFSESAIDGLMKFTQNFAIPTLLFRAISTLDLGQSFDPALLTSFYTGALTGFLVAFAGARFLFHRPWPDSVAIGFGGLFSNSVLLGLAITERAYGVDALASNFVIVSVHAPFCYVIGVTAMEFARAEGKGLGATLLSVLRAMSRNALVIGITAGFVVNFSGLAMPMVFTDAVDMMARAALPAAIFGLGGVLACYRPEGDMGVVALICLVSLVLHPTITYALGRAFTLSDAQLRSAVLTAAMAPGINIYVFANMYGVARRVAATAVLSATALSIGTVWIWLSILP
ncbi:AEC family transporter [Aliiroseovarius subalbicans]|uniref:AEC family transporter n=1 Tax=Aliiroseovarius subalbicans TaxID=2925840 RepID=UPI001F57E9D2|nr:AEC family transporter [Aliiroseovarius subalbicans]MCI2399253.1 AEC family transporter [Aliiroseovarius subalbicans]